MNNPKLIFSHLCDHALVSAEGKLSVIGIFKEIGGKNIPAIHPMMTLAFEIYLGDTENHNLKIEFKNPDGNDFNDTYNLIINAPSVNQNFGRILKIVNIKFTKEGVYKIIIYIDDKKIGEESLTFRII